MFAQMLVGKLSIPQETGKISYILIKIKAAQIKGASDPYMWINIMNTQDFVTWAYVNATDKIIILYIQFYLF